MILKDLGKNLINTLDHLGDLTPHITKDGSFSLKNSYYGESFHSSTGARQEAEHKFLHPSEINRFLECKRINVLDVCVGLGYNSACIFEEIIKTPIHLNWWGVEIDKRPLEIALENTIFRKSWSLPVLKILDSIKETGQWHNSQSNGKVLWGDARRTIDLIPYSFTFDLILHDAFSPTKCPQLWSEEFLHTLTRKLAPNGRLITYSSSAAIRGSLRRAGLELNSIVPIHPGEKKWSEGTIAIQPVLNKNLRNNSKGWGPLSNMEEQHLLTSAAIPYRDPNKNRSSLEILTQREIEQKNSTLQSTSSWKKFWGNAESG